MQRRTGRGARREAAPAWDAAPTLGGFSRPPRLALAQSGILPVAPLVTRISCCSRVPLT